MEITQFYVNKKYDLFVFLTWKMANDSNVHLISPWDYQCVIFPIKFNIYFLCGPLIKCF